MLYQVRPVYALVDKLILIYLSQEMSYTGSGFMKTSGRFYNPDIFIGYVVTIYTE